MRDREVRSRLGGIARCMAMSALAAAASVGEATAPVVPRSRETWTGITSRVLGRLKCAHYSRLYSPHSRADPSPVSADSAVAAAVAAVAAAAVGIPVPSSDLYC